MTIAQIVFDAMLPAKRIEGSERELKAGLGRLPYEDNDREQTCGISAVER